jgi:transitional endoplasmic reticulum ATPase
MALRRRRRKRRESPRPSQGIDRTDRFLMRKTATYLLRHLKAFPQIQLEEDFFDLLAFGIDEGLDKIIELSLDRVDARRKAYYEAIVDSCIDNNSRFNDIIPCILERSPKPFQREIRKTIVEVLEKRLQNQKYKGLSAIERNLKRLQEVFSLTDPETELALFLYLMSYNPKLDGFFVDELQCQRLNGRKYLANALDLTRKELNQILNGTLKKIGLFELTSASFELASEFLGLFEGTRPEAIADNYFKEVAKETIPLTYHLSLQEEIAHVVSLLKAKPETSTHILFYGPPGTGKSSLAQGLVNALKLPGYEIVKNEENSSKHTRSAIMACLNLTNGGEGSLILVDEADNLLNTDLSWLFRGETQDKGWLNHFMEEPGARMIWITNEIEEIAPSVLRRFAFSLQFKPFNKQQRVFLWENVLKRNKAKLLLTKPEILDLARKYKVSAGAIDLAVKKARESRKESKQGFREAVEAGLEAHRTLVNFGQRSIDRDQLDQDYSLEGLNLKGNLQQVLEQLDRLDQYLRKPSNDSLISLNLIFHGPPGTGKTELAKYIGRRLDREIISKRASDLQSKWVGETEKNIRDAFEEAEREEAVLLMDEADSFLFSRERAQRSWEISATNEFLTRMEGYRGILICTTNRLKDLDGASIRRFQEKLEFDYLKPDGNQVFYDKLLGSLVQEPFRAEYQARLRAIDRLAPGDFKTVRDRYGFRDKADLTHQILIEALQEEAKIKGHFIGLEPIGF